MVLSQRKTRVFLGALLASLIILGIITNMFSSLRMRLLLPVSLYTLRLAQKVGPPYTFLPRSELLARIDELERKNESLQNLLVASRLITDEYQKIKQDISGSPRDGTHVAADVMLSRSDVITNMLVVGAGERAGIMSGALVEKDSQFIGFVRDVGTNISRVELLTSLSVEIPGILEKTGIPLILRGRGAGFMISQVPKDIRISLGEVVVADLPGRLIVGEVVDVKMSDANPLAEILVRSGVSLHRLRSVHIRRRREEML